MWNLISFHFDQCQELSERAPKVPGLFTCDWSMEPPVPPIITPALRHHIKQHNFIHIYTKFIICLYMKSHETENNHSTETKCEGTLNIHEFFHLLIYFSCVFLLFFTLPSEFIWGCSWRAVAAGALVPRGHLKPRSGALSLSCQRPKIKLSSPSSSHPELAPTSLHLNSHSWCLLWTGAVREDKERLPGGWERDALHQQIYPHWCFDVTTGSSGRFAVVTNQTPIKSLK